MRISNIKQYLGGADNVIARDIIEGDQFVFNFQVGSESLTNYSFDVDTELFKADVTSSGSNITINSLTSQGHTHTYSTSGTNSIITLDTADSTSANLLIPSTLLSDLDATVHSSPDSSSPYIIAMSVSIVNAPTITATTGTKRTFRLLWIVRYRPIVT